MNNSSHTGVIPAHLPGFLKGKEDVSAGRLYSPEESRERNGKRFERAAEFIALGQK